MACMRLTALGCAFVLPSNCTGWRCVQLFQRVIVVAASVIQLLTTREPEHQKRQIVALCYPCTELVNLVEYTLKQFAWREIAVGSHRPAAALHRILPIRVSRLRHAYRGNDVDPKAAE